MTQPSVQTEQAGPSLRPLPSVYSREYSQFGNNTNVSEAFERNPLLKLCCKLATFRSGKKGEILLFKNLKGSKRLYNLIGYALPKTSFKRLSLLSREQWNTLEQSWTANMHSVLLNPDFNPLIYDEKLIDSIKRYKIWFLRFFLRGKIILKSDGTSEKKKHVVLSNLDKGLTALKTVAGYFQWYLTNDVKSNRRPPVLPFWKGWDHRTQTLNFVWFSGHLSHYRSLERDFSDADLAALAQIRTFGRALPPPSRNACRKDLLEQIKILCEPRLVPEEWLQMAEISAKRAAIRWSIREMPRVTHFSMSTSGCAEIPSTKGGQAAYFRLIYGPWALTKVDDFIFRINDTGEEVKFPFICENSQISDMTEITDCYGQYVFPNKWEFPPTFEWGFCLLDVAYRRLGATFRIAWAYKLIENFQFSREIGPLILLLATAESYRQGHFVDLDGNSVEPDYYLETGKFPKIPLFKGKRILRYKVDIPPLANLTCLAEPGAKTRPLGNNQVHFLVITRAMRFMVEPIFARDGRLRIGLRSTNKMWSFLKFLQTRSDDWSGFYAQSSDFKSSTDYIPLSLINAIWKGISSEIPEDHPFMVYYDYIVSTRRLSLLDFKELYSFISNTGEEGKLPFFHQCGSFMGEAMSFMTLSLVTVVIDDVTEFLFRKEFNKFQDLKEDSNQMITLDLPKYAEEFANSDNLAPEPACGCGDDWAAIRKYFGQITLWKSVACSMGMVFSWKDAVSRRILIFCEDHAQIGADNKVVYIDIIKSRLLTSMTRQHSDNRSSILGKGRMLRNQLDYFENKGLKSSIMTVYREIFSQVYKDTLKWANIPLWLPPACGGVGLPMLESEVPASGWKFIRYIYDITEMKDPLEKALLSYELKTLNKPQKKGISTWEKSLEIFRKVLTGHEGKAFTYHQYDGDLTNCEVNGFTIYNDNFVKDLLSFIGINVPMDPYDPSRQDFDALKNEASLINFIKIDDLLDEIERSCNFHEFLTKEVTREQRTLHKYCKDASRYWRKVGIFPNEGTNGLTRADCPKFTTWVKLEKELLFGLNGWIYMGDQSHNVFETFPTLKVSFSSGRRKVLPDLGKPRNIPDFINIVNASLKGEDDT
jgi:hypothetical protein